MLNLQQQQIIKLSEKPYKYGFVTDIKEIKFQLGLNKLIINKISKKKKEPFFFKKWRQDSYKKWKLLSEPSWAKIKYKKLDYNSISYYSEPDKHNTNNKFEDIDPKLLETYNRLGISLEEQKFLTGVAVDIIFDSVSIITVFKEQLSRVGIIFCPISEAIQKYPSLIEKFLGKVVPKQDNYFTALNSSVFSDGSFVYIPKGTNCPVELSTYFRINAKNIGQFERTLIIVEENSFVSYLEGCTAPMRPVAQLHAAIVELIAFKNSTIKYSTIQNWYPGDKYGNGGIFNFVTKRGLCKGQNSIISWTQIETGAAITWKYPSVILYGYKSKGEFYSVALTKNKQQADTGTKMIHIGEKTKSTIIAKGISLNTSINCYRGLVKILAQSNKSRNFSQCDSILVGSNSLACTYPTIINKNNTAKIEHEATTSKISEEQLLYCNQRGINKNDAICMIINGFCKDVFTKLPLEFAVEIQKLVEISLENNVE